MNRPATDFLKIESLMMNGVVFRTIMECLKIKLFDDFEEHFFSSGEYAKKRGFKEQPTTAMLELLTANGLLIKTAEGYTNSRLSSEHMITNAPHYQGSLLKINCHFNESISSNLLTTLKGANDSRENCDESWAMEESIKGSAAHARLGALQDTTEFIYSLPEFPQMRTMCDIGGCHGEFTMALLDKNPTLSGEITDFPEVCEVAAKHIPLHKYQDRITLIPRDLRSEQLSKKHYDLIIASHVLYAFMDKLDEILNMIHNALNSGGWFVTQHMDKNGSLPPDYANTLEFITRMSGYDTHFIDTAELIAKLEKAGFHCPPPASAGYNGIGAIVAGQK
ncbi:class I SAM-dependent methyltransferase [Maridesulfovibrio sp.]|uniref:class I SAM-dependent methyltransferase n=1 Tax=Maridesulfovibrio sp. TaxID=2795000 RepID=UPI003BA89E9C